MIHYGEPYEKMRGLARLSDAQLDTATRWGYWVFFIGMLAFFACAIAGIFTPTILLAVISLVAMAFAFAVTPGAQLRRDQAWRPITEPVTVTDIIRTTTTSDADPSILTKRFRVCFAESSKRSHEVMGNFDEAIAIGSTLKGDIWPYGGQVRNLKVMPSQA